VRWSDHIVNLTFEKVTAYGGTKYNSFGKGKKDRTVRFGYRGIDEGNSNHSASGAPVGI